MSPNSDAELMARVQAGDEQAFADLVDRHKDGVVGYLCRMVGHRDRAEELAQEAFLKLYTAAGRYTENGHLKAYLFRIATNLVRSDARRERRRRLLLGWLGESEPLLAAVPAGGLEAIPVEGGPFTEGPAPQPDADVLRAELQERLAAAVSELPLAYRVPLVLHDIEEWTYNEISRSTGWKEGTVKSRISRGRRLLREKLEPFRATVMS